MLANELRALEIYLESATFENDFRPISYSKIADRLKEEEFSGTKSSVGRWAIKHKWEELLHRKRQEAVIASGSDDLQNKALKIIDEKTEVTVKRNGELISDTYDVMEAFLQRVKDDVSRGVIRRDDIKLAKDIAVLVTGREDKMLDRLAGVGADTISSEDALKELGSIDVEIEDE